jgi:hypothetical protein
LHTDAADEIDEEEEIGKTGEGGAAAEEECGKGGEAAAKCSEGADVACRAMGAAEMCVV